jgi:mitochondrial fission protein ELM1
MPANSTSAEQGRPVVVWCFTDGKAGHENQVQGLLAALRTHIPVEDYVIPAARDRHPLWSLLTGRDAAGRGLPDPDLIAGAGRATHLPMLAARRARGGRVIVLMKPDLPLSWFDLCIIPRHDRPRPLPNVMPTRGVLNRIHFHADKDETAGLFLVGGPSAHVDWSSEALFGQIRDIVEQTPAMHWQLATSRRTPADFVERLRRHPFAQLTVVPVDETGPGWLPEQLGIAAVVWVSSDSVSMVYEALTSGAAVGLLSVPYRKARDRLAGGLQELRGAGLVTDHEGWQQGRELTRPAVPLDEAGRCAKKILDEWLTNN